MALLISSTGVFLFFDTVIKESYEEDAVVTDHPVENTVSVTDHRQEMPLQVTIEGVVSGSPFQGSPGGDNIAGASRIISALDFLREHRGDVFTYETVRYGDLENMMIQSMQHEVTERLQAVITLELKQVRFAESQIVDLPPEFIAPKTHKPKKQCGHQGTDNLEDAAAGEGLFSVEARSTLDRLISLGGDRQSTGSVLGGTQ